MKTSKAITVLLIFVILSIGAVSAADTTNNTISTTNDNQINSQTVTSDNISNNESKDSFTDHIGGYSYSNSWCRTYNNGITSTEDEYGNLRFSNGEYATRTSDGYYYFSNGITGYEDSYGDIHLSNGQVIIKK